MKLVTAVAAAVGIVIAWQAATLGAASRTLNPLSISLGLLLSGLLSGAVWATTAGAWPDVHTVVRRWWWLPLGVAGWLLVAAIGAVVARMGVAAALSVIIAAQLVTGLALDVARGSRDFTARAVLAIVLIAASVWLLHPPDP